MITGGVHKTLTEKVIFEDGKTYFRGVRVQKYTIRDRVRDIDHSRMSISIFLN